MALNYEDEKLVLDYVFAKGHGVKGLVDSGVSKVPNTFIQPPEKRPHQPVLGNILEPIDLSKLDGPDHDLVVKAIATAAEKVGFFQVVNHGVPLELLDSMIASAYRFFNLPGEAKAVYHQEVSPSPLVIYSTSFLSEKESFLEWRDYLIMVYTNDEQALLHWPKECREDALNYLNSSRNMMKTIIDILLRNLGGPSDTTGIDFSLIPKAVNINFYPACPNPDLAIGVKGHSDLTAITVLLQDGIGGLQVKVEQDIVDLGVKKGEWIDISPVSGALVVNLGDVFQIISNGQYTSAEHRVRTTKGESRVSIPIFATPNLEKISPLPHLVKRDGVCRYREVVYADLFQNYFKNPHDGKKSLDFAKIDYSP